MTKLVMPLPYQDLIDQFLQFTHSDALKKSQKISEVPKKALEDLLRAANQKRNELIRNLEYSYEEALNFCRSYGRSITHGSPIAIDIESAQVRQAMFSSEPITILGKIRFSLPLTRQKIEVDCYVTYGNWKRLKNIKERTFNLMDHLEDLLPKRTFAESRAQKHPVGLITYQNGIKNTLEAEFKDMGNLIINQFPEGTLCIGLHNQTTEFVLVDMMRFPNEQQLNKNSVYSLYQTFITFADLLRKINPNLTWVHIAHSEGGLIGNTALSLCEQPHLREVASFLKSHLVTISYGAVKPFPDEPVLEAINTYSKKDIALILGSKYLDKDVDKMTGESYTSRKYYQGRTYTVKVIDTKLDIKCRFDVSHLKPEALTLEQKLNLTWLEWMAHIRDPDDLPHTTYRINKGSADKLNRLTHRIDDHLFGSPSYEQTLKADIDHLRDQYKIYDTKINR